MAKRLERLEDDLDALRDTIFSVRSEEFKRLVLKEVQGVFEEYGQEYVRGRVDCMDDHLACSKRRFCENAINSTVEAASLAYLRGDCDRTMELLDGLESNVSKLEDACEAGDCRSFVVSLVSEIKTVFMLARRIADRIDCLPSSPSMSLSDLDPESVAEQLAPLSHPLRVGILTRLSERERSFSELSRDLDLRTGHLQFHLKALDEGGYVHKGRKRGSYRITVKGMTALDGLRGFMTGLVCI